MIENIFQNMRPFAHRKNATTIFIMMTHMMFFVFHAGSWFLASTVPSDQALVRERAADYTKDGREVPRDLMSKPRCSERPERGDARRCAERSDRVGRDDARGDPGRRNGARSARYGT